MPKTDKYTGWCSGCGREWAENTAVAHYSLEEHEQNCSFRKDMNAYFDTNVDKAHQIKTLLPWFGSFKTFWEYLKNDEDISKINREDFNYNDNYTWRDEYSEWFTELRKRKQNMVSSSGSSEYSHSLQHTDIPSIALDLRSSDVGLVGGVITFGEKKERSVSDASNSSSSTISHGTKKRLEAKITNLENKLSNIENLLAQLLNKQCPCQQQAQVEIPPK